MNRVKRISRRKARIPIPRNIRQDIPNAPALWNKPLIELFTYKALPTTAASENMTANTVVMSLSFFMVSTVPYPFSSAIVISASHVP
jgi:hypothetical protein